MKIVFWTSNLILIYIYFGYPILLWVVNKFFKNPVNKEYITPKLSFVVVAHNEEKHIEEKIKNILELNYPKENLEIIIGSDASSDRTNEMLGGYRVSGVGYRGENIKVVVSKEHVGKVNLLNGIVSEAAGEIIVFSDIRQEFEKNALKELTANFNDEKVGCVSGELVFRGDEKSGVAKGVNFYWKYEKFMRKTESSIYSMIGATGAIYAIRKSLFVIPSEDTILDDVFIPLKVVEQGYRAVFDSRAIAYDSVASTSREEFTRKVRTLAGNFQLFVYCKELFNPFKSKVAIQFFSHKFLRAFSFLFLIFAFGTNIYLVNVYPYNLFMVAQIIFYLLALSGWIMERVSFKSKLFSIPYVFCMLNFAALKGFLNFLMGKQSVRWEKAHRVRG